MKSLRKNVFIGGLFLLIIAVSCKSPLDDSSGKSSVAVKKVELNKTETTLTVGGSDQLTATITPGNASNKKLLWESSDETIATVDENGVISGISEGPAIITVTTASGGKTAECQIQVNAAHIPVSGVSLSPVTLGVSDELKITPSIVPSSATNKSVEWLSLNPNVAIIDEEGNIRGMTPGTVTIHVKTSDGGHTATCTITVTAASLETITITFDSASGSSVSSQSGIKGTQIAKPADPTRSGYTFDGWFENNDYSGSPVSFPYTLTVSRTLYAKWTETASTISVTGVTLNKNSHAMGTGETLTLTASIVPDTATNKQITWSSSNTGVATVASSGSGKALVTGLSGGSAVITVTTADGGFTASCTVTVTALITVTFNSKGGSAVQPQTVSPGSSVTKPSDPAKSDYRFAGWYTTDTYSGAAVTFPYIVNADITLYAKWEIPVTGVTLNKATAAIAVGEKETLAATIAPADATNKTLQWTSSAPAVASVSNGEVTGKTAGSAVITVQTADGSYEASCTVTVSAASVPVTITFNSKEGSAVTAWNGNAGDEMAKPADPTRSGYTFDGWYIAEDYSGNPVSFPYVVTASATLYAKWTETISVISVTGVVLDIETHTMAVGETLTLTATVAPADATNKQISWTSSNTSAATVADGLVTGMGSGASTITVTTADGSFTASCTITVKTKSTLTFNSKGGSSVASQTVFTGESVNRPSDPARSGYAFSGWYTTEAYTGSAVSFPYTVSANTTLYAKWILKVSGVSLDRATLGIGAGETEILTATVIPSNADDTSVVWTSGNTSVATVINGTVLGKAAGTAVITVRTVDGNFEANCTVTVTAVLTQCATPVINTNTGTATTQFTLTTATVGADIYYTTNGTTPTTASTKYTAAFTLASGSHTIKAIAVKTGMANSELYSTTVTVSGTVTDRIILHVKDYAWVYVWETTDTSINKLRFQMAAEGNGWYGYTFTVTSASLIFTPNDSWSGQSADLTRTAGEWWYKNGSWTDYNPERPATPAITASPSAGLYLSAQSVTLSSSNASGDVIYYTSDGSTPTLSSPIYSAAISAGVGTTTIKAIGYNPEAVPTTGSVATFTYTVDPDADIVPPTITANPAPGMYDNPITAIFTLADNKGTTGLRAYYTTDGTEPTESSVSYTSGTGISIGQDEVKRFRFLVIDAAGNRTTETFYYRVGQVTTSRFDPRQETIYFLLTTRWFDGDTSNSVGDDWCSYTPERVSGSIANHGFTGPEDVTWRGDFKGLVDKMDYIKALGFTTIWITPIVQNRSPLAYHGYHAWDMTREDARLESPGYDFQRVIDEAHARDMKICLDIVINHSGRFGLKDFAEVKYNRDAGLYPVPTGWESFTFDESAYQSGNSQNYPNGWQYDGLASPGNYPAGHAKAGQRIPAYATFTQDSRPFTAADIAQYPALATDKANGYLKYQWPSTESYVKTIDGKPYSEPNSLDYSGYKNSARRLRGHNTGFPTGSGSFDNFPDAHFDSLHEDCPDLNVENPEVQQYILNAYFRYIDMGVDMFRVDTVMHMHKQTLNEMYWPQMMARAESASAARGGADFFIFGEVANFVNNLDDRPAQLQQSNYTWDMTVEGKGNSSNHLLNGNNYRTPDYSHKTVPSSPYHVSVIDIISHNGFCDGVGGAYGRALGNSYAYNDATYLTWYTDSHDYGPNKGETRWQGDFAAAWSMLFTFRGIPVVYYGSEIRFAAGLPNDWPGGGSAGADMSLEKTGRSYYGPNLEGNVTATGFGEYSASGQVATTLSHELAKHLQGLNKIRHAVPALQMGQYSTDGHSGGWAGYKRRYTGTNKITGAAIDSYVLVGVGQGTHTWTGVLNGTYIDCVTGNSITVTNGNTSFTVSNGGDAGLGVYVLTGLTTPAPGKIDQPSPYLK
ncbi:Ig-like domain-containing protein [Brucepastera parasyntrophica]|uniref:Ig-like domain-containing protein n=1 Tax=Brucepastera parasyntrophica TaxID=2880008 RepID=UPI00210AED32|nr:Ig-like domain-containing protein [Brucepastera parasyntrophica]ULQ60955.1 Ig-like domain-containing protein [Brucepastera parasyntrophica]